MASSQHHHAHPRTKKGRLLARCGVVSVCAVIAATLNAVPADSVVTPEWKQEAESFSTKTTGAQFSDANASASAAWNIWTDGYIQTSFTAATTGAKQIDVVARGNVAAGVWPIMRVYVDGTQLSEETVASSSYGTYSTTVTSLTSGSHTLKIEFGNDAVVGGEDRNLKVDVASMVPSGIAEWTQEVEAFPTKTAGGQAADGSASGGQYWNLWSNGYAETTSMTADTSGTKQIKVIARGDPAGGVWPNMRILVDGVILANITVGTATWQPYTTTTTLSKGTHTLRIQFTNDQIIGTEDRNLKVDVASLVPVAYEWKQEAESFTTKTAGAQTPSALASAGQFWNLWSNGYLETTMSAASSGRKEIRFIARGAPANGIYPIVKVYVGGALVQQLTVSSDTFATYVVTATMNVGANVLRIEFINNDTNLNGGDRNVHLDVATLIGDNAFPFVQGIPSPANNSYVGTMPTLRAVYADPDGDAGFVDFEIYTHPAGTLVTSGRSPSTAAGDAAAWTAGVTLVNGQQYRWRARAFDGTSYAGAWFANQYLTVDGMPPVSPTVSSTTYPSGTWSGTHGQAGAFTFSPGTSTDVVGYKFRLDDSPPQDTTSTSVTLSPEEGQHHLYVQSVDRADNVSGVTDYAFNVGGGAITSPRDGDTTGKRFALRAVTNPTFTGITYQWRRADTDAWTTIPGADVTGPGGAVTWPVALAAGTHASLDWDVSATLAGVDGPFSVRASFTGGSPPTTAGTNVVLDQNTSNALTIPAGPDSGVNLLTGNLTLNATDVGMDSFAGGVGVTRSHNSRNPSAAATGPFGPGWSAGLSVDSAPGQFSGLTVSGTLRTVALVNGETLGFTATSGTAFEPEPGAPGFALTMTAGSGTPGSQTDDVYELADLAGNKSVFTWQTSGFLTTSVVEAATSFATAFTYETVGGVTRVSRAVAPAPAGVTCTSPTTTRGCRTLTFDYAPAGTPVPGPSGGDYEARLRSVSTTAWDPATGAMATVEIAHWSYLPSGRLMSAWDPRVPNLKTTYAYDGSGRVTTVTPPGEEPVSFGYTTIPGDTNGGRLRTVTRSALSAGTATTTLVYRVPVSGPTAPFDLSSTELARWGQTDTPTDATAVFPATQPPGDNPVNGTLPASYERASVHYMDVTGRPVNSLAPGGSVSVVEYDDMGNVVRRMSAGNRAKALAANPTDTAAQEAALAARLSTANVYSADGLNLLETFGPEHEVMLTAAVTDSLGRAWPVRALVRARPHTVSTYDEGAPPGGPYGLTTTVRSSARIADTTTDADLRTTTTQYDWTLRAPTVVTRDPNGLNLISRTSYDATTGLPTKSTLPGGTAAQDTAHTLVNTYYVSGTHPAYTECGNHPEWANLLCRTDVAAQPVVTAERPAIPSKHYAYDLFGALTTTTEKNGATVLRTWTQQYDSAHRPWRTSVTATAGDAVPTIENYFDPGTGKALETRTLDGGGAITARITRAFDTLGRPSSYTDADGNVSSVTYDLLSRPLVTNDGKATRTHYYDDGPERRGLLTRIVDSAAGTFTATYDADGTVATQDYPNGLRATTTRNEAGAPVRLDYTKGGSTWLSFKSAASAHGEWLAATSAMSSQAFSYDAAGRLVQVEDTVSGAGCTIRAYTVDADANRTALTTRQPSSEGECDAGGPASAITYGYDAASRLTSAGYVYDALGRTTSVPAGDSGGNALTATYFVNDMVRSLTAQDGTTRTWTLDVSQRRLRSWTDNGVTKVNHYAGDVDTPAWIDEGASTWTRFVGGIGGGLAGIQSSAGGVTLQLANLHGDVVATATTDPSGTAPTAAFESAEFGAPRDGVARRYGWLGESQRSAETPAGVLLMGVRLYNPATGRFLQTDPETGGSANPYDYANHDPVNGRDLDGRWSYSFSFYLGWTAYAASTVFSKLRNNFGPIFGFKAPYYLPSSGKVTLYGPLNVPQPVKVVSMWSSGWRFDTMWGHADHGIFNNPANITFNITGGSRSNMYLKVNAYVPWNATWLLPSTVAACKWWMAVIACQYAAFEAYKWGLAYKSWSDFAKRLKAYVASDFTRWW